MTGTASTAPTTLPGSARRNLIYAFAGAISAGLIIYIGNINVAPGEHGGAMPALVTGIVCTLTMLACFAVVVPRTHTATATLLLGIITLLSLAVFWSGLSPVLAAATAAAHAHQDERARRGTLGLVISILAAALAVAWTLLS